MGTHRRLSAGMQGSDVTALHDQLHRLGFPLPDVEVDEQRFGEGTAGSVRAFQQGEGLPTTGAVDEATSARLAAALPPDPIVPVAEPGTFVVRGLILRNGRPHPVGLVRAFDRGLRSEQMLGEASLDREGRYEIAYSTGQSTRNGGSRADLIVRVFHDDGVTEAAASRILFNAGPIETIDLDIGTDRQPSSEYERYLAEVEPVLEGVAPADLTDDDRVFLHEVTGIDTNHLTFLSTAARQAEQTGLPSSIFYGLFRQGLPLDYAGLVAAGPRAHRRAIEASLHEKIVPAALQDDLDELLPGLQQALLQHAFEPSENGRRLPMAELLASTPLSRAARDTFVDRYLTHEGPAEDFWESLREHPEFRGNGHLDDVRFTLELSLLTQDNPPLVRALKERRGSATTRVRELAQLEDADWKELIDGLAGGEDDGIPSHVTGETREERRDQYARSIRETLEAAFPTTFVALGLAREPDTRGDPIRRDLTRFFENEPDFELAGTRIDDYLAEHQTALMGVAELNRAAVIDRLKATQRVFRVAPRYEHLRALMQEGLDSAHAIAGYSRKTFVERFADALGGEARASTYHANARQIDATNTSAYASVYQELNDVLPYAIGGSSELQRRRVASIAQAADWPSLFGRIDLCACEHCRSLYSPAAYLVDLLEFLRKCTPSEGKTPLDVLLDRRPDLEHIKLTCENTNTPLPYIDLVNEILEFYVAHDTLTKDAARDTRDITADELSVNPQYTIEAAYDTLAKAVYPVALPFDRPLAVIRTYLQHLGSSRFDVMETFGVGGQPSDIDLASEYLRLSFAEREIVTGSGTAPLQAYYGFGESALASWQDDIAPVPAFLWRTGISYVELLELLKTHFVNESGAIAITIDASGGNDAGGVDACDPSNLSIAGLDQDTLSRIHRFIRLQRKLNWSIQDLDKTLTALGAGEIDESLLENLACVARLREALKRVPPLGMLSLWSDIDTEGEDALYPRLFLSKAVINPVDPAFSLDQLANGSETISAHVPTILAALGVTEVDLSAIRESLGLADETALLTLANLSALYRHALLARGLRLKVEDLFALEKLTGIDPFQAGDPKPTVAFVQVVEKVRSSNFPVAELSYLYRHLAEVGRYPGPSQQQIDRLLEQLKTGLQRIADETTPGVDPLGERTRQQLALLWDEVSIEQFVNLLLGSVTYLAPLTASPPVTDFPGLLANKVTYDPDAQILRFVGPMALDEQTALLSLSSDPAYQAAVDELFKQPRAVMSDVFSTSALDTAFLTLADATEGLLDSPAPTAEERFGFVLERLLPYLGAMLSKGFVVQTLSTVLDLEPTVTRLLLDGVLGASSDPGQPLMADFQPLHEVAFPANYLRLHKVGLLLKGFALTAREVAHLSSNPADFGDFDLNSLPLDRTDPAQTDADAVALFAQWHRLYDFTQLRDRLHGHDLDMLDVFAAATSGDPAATLSKSVIDAVTEATGWDAAELAQLSGPNGFQLTDADFTDEKWLLRLEDAVQLSHRLGVSAETLFELALSVPDTALADDVVHITKSRYERAQWLSVAKPLNDSLRERQRAALVAYVLAHEHIVGEGISTANQLFEYFLIDVGMDPRMTTSRIKQANSSVQLFIQRCLMNLEQQVLPDAIDDEQWKWMKNYRVWEANRKVFLYPENWIEPELRDDKSPFFQELESELLQEELTEDSAERIFKNYLSKLDEVARLEIVGMCHQDQEGEDDTSAVLHIFGRTRNPPHVYYYRRRNAATGVWTGWEKVNVDIASDGDGVHLIPVVWNRRLHLFWPIFSEKPSPSQPIEGAAVKQWGIKLAWSQYENTGWSPKRLTAGELESPSRVATRDYEYIETVQDGQIVWVHLGPALRGLVPPAKFTYLPPKHTHYFGVTLGGGGLYIRCHRRFSVGFQGTIDYLGNVWKAESGVMDHDLVGLVGFGGCDASGEAVTLMAPIPFGYTVAYAAGINSFMHVSPGTDYLGAGFSLPPQTRLLHKTPSIYQFVNSPTEGDLDVFPELSHAYQPFVFQDADGTYLATKIDRSRTHSDLFGPASKAVPDFAEALESAVQDFGSALRGSPASGGARSREADGVRFVSIHADRSREVETLQRAVQAVKLSRAPMGKGSFGLAANGHDSLVTVNPADRFKDSSLWQFSILFHPHVCAWMKALRRGGVEELLRLDSQRQSNDGKSGSAFYNRYGPTHKVNWNGTREGVDFRSDGAYSLYNWELFCQIPIRIATNELQNQRFENAMRWFHFVFDPTASTNGSPPARYWNVLPFYDNSDPGAEQIRALLMALNTGDDALQQQVAAWRENPFNPHLLARMRITAYQKNVVMKYIDNLIAWGDQLFSRDTIESVNEATQLYMLAANILGARPERMPAAGAVQPETYSSLKAKHLDAFSNALVQMETAFPYGHKASGGVSAAGQGLNLGTTFYFCIPQNEMLLGYWDTVEDRLFKIRHGMNFEGVLRELPLFEPPIDPALLVKAFAMGLDIGSVLNDLSAPLPRFRFSVMVQKAIDLSSEVRALGGALLSVLEKKDSEALALLRSTHEIGMLKVVTEVRKRQIDEAKETLEGIQKSRLVVEARRNHYRDIDKYNASEKQQRDQLTKARPFNQLAQGINALGSTSSLAPDVDIGTTPGGATGAPGPVLKSSYGGSNVGGGLQAVAARFSDLAAGHTHDASMAAIKGGHDRRWDDWRLQEKLATRELHQIDRQIASAEIRLAIAEQELRNHELQTDHTAAVDEYMRGKYTNVELYGWMLGQLSAVYFQTYKLAYDVAKRAERAYRFERGLTDSSFIQFGYWDSLRKGLLSGEKLNLDLKRMEVARLEHNRREYEITKQISLVLHDPMALLALKQTGECVVDLPEALFDMDYPGHYMRRVRSVSLTIPCVTGPYTNINCTLTLLKNKVRIDSNAQQDYIEQDDDARFVTNFAAIQSIATSHGRGDTGMFELNFRDERYLPFEGAGAESRWRIEMPKECNAFDFETIADVILEVRYTARDGGTRLREKARAEVIDAPQTAVPRLFSLRHEFPNEWHRFLHPTAADSVATLDLAPERFPFRLRNKDIEITEVELFVKPRGNAPVDLAIALTPPGRTPDPALDTIALNDTLGGMLRGGQDFAAAGPGQWTVTAIGPGVENLTESVADLALLCYCSVASG